MLSIDHTTDDIALFLKISTHRAWKATLEFLSRIEYFKELLIAELRVPKAPRGAP